LVIHDLVHVHYPDAVPDDVCAELERVLPRRAAEATLCACMSRFILETDLRGVLKLAEEKLRMVRPAPPAECGMWSAGGGGGGEGRGGATPPSARPALSVSSPLPFLSGGFSILQEPRRPAGCFA
jgi:hypothetical protein